MAGRWALLLAMALLWAAAPADVSADPIADCNASTDPQLQIRACSILVEDVTISPSNRAIAYVNRANAYGGLKRSREALSDYAAAIALNPNDALAFYNRGNVLFDVGQWQDAMRDYGKAIELADAFALAYFNRGLVRERLGDLAGAVNDYKAAEALDDPVALKARTRRQRLEARLSKRSGSRIRD